MPEVNQIKTQLVVEDQFSNAFSSLNGRLVESTNASQRFERGFTTCMYNSAMATQTFGNQFNTQFGQVNTTLAQTNSSLNQINGNNAFGGQSRLIMGITRFRTGMTEAKLLINDINDAFTVLTEHFGSAERPQMSFFAKIGLARKIIKLLGFDGIKKILTFIRQLDAFKNQATDAISSLSSSLASLAEKSESLMHVLKPFIKIAGRFVPILNVILPHAEQLPAEMNSASESIGEFGQKLESVQVPGAKLVHFMDNVKAFFNSEVVKEIALTAALSAAIIGAIEYHQLFIDKVLHSQVVLDMWDKLKSKLDEVDTKMMASSELYYKLRKSMMDFGNLDGAYFGIRNMLTDGFEGLKKKILNSDFGMRAQFQLIAFKIKLGELDTKLMWHSRTYAKFRNQMMDRGFFGAIWYNIQRADNYLIKHSEGYVKFRKIVNKQFNKIADYYEKNWKNLFKWSRVYLASMKNDIKDAFLVKSVDENGMKHYDFLPSNFLQALISLETYKNLWGKCSEYLHAFYKDLKDTPLGGPLLTMEIWVARIKKKVVDDIAPMFVELKDKIVSSFGDVKDWFGDLWLSAKIYVSSAINYITENWDDLILTFKIKFAALKAQFVELARDLMEVGLLVRKIIKYVEGLKVLWEGLQFANEKVGELIEQTEYLNKIQSVYTMFGQEAGKEFERFAEKASLELGKTKAEILDAGLAFRKFGFSNQSIADIVNLSDRLEDLNPGQSFQSVRDSILEAFKSGSSEGLAELIGGGRGTKVERQMRKMHLDRFLRKGDVQGFIREFEKLADAMGYTQERADQMDETIGAKLNQIKSHLDRITEKVKTMIFDKIKPYVEKVLDFLNSPEFQAWFNKVVRQVSAIASIISSIVGVIVDVGMEIIKWWIEPSGEFLRRIMLVVALFFVIRKVVAIVHVITFAMGALLIVLKLIRHPINMIIHGFLRAKHAASGFFHRVKHDSSMLSGIASAVITGLVVGGSFAYRSITGESHGFLEDFIRFIVPGIIVGWYNILNFGIRIWNKIKNVVRNVIQGILTIVIEGVSKMIQIINPLFLLINQITKQFDEEVATKHALEFEVAVARKLKDKGIISEEKWNAVGGIGSKVIQAEMAAAKLSDEGRGVFDWKAPVLGRFEDTAEYSEEEIMKKAEEGLAAALKGKDTVLDAFGLNTLDSYMLEWEEMNKQLQDGNDHLAHIRKNTKEMDLLWMRELAEQRFVNNVNVRQLTPTVNVKVSGSKSTPQDTADAIARELNQMADAGTFNAYGSPA